MIPVYNWDFVPFLNCDVFCIKTLGIFRYNYNRIQAERLELNRVGKLEIQDEESKVMTSLRLIEELSNRSGGIVSYHQCIRYQYYTFYGINGEIKLSYESLEDIVKLYKYYILGIGGLNEHLGINEQHYLEWSQDVRK